MRTRFAEGGTMGRSAEAWADEQLQQELDDEAAALAHQEQLEAEAQELIQQGMTPEEVATLKADPAYSLWLDILDAEGKTWEQ